MDVLARFPRVWCPACNKTKPMTFDVMKANDKNDHDAADIVCDECKSIIATLHGPSTHRAGVRTDRAAKARAMAGQEIDRQSDPSATEEERQRRKRRLLKGPKEFRDVPTHNQAACGRLSGSPRNEPSMHFLLPINRWPGSCSCGW